MNQTKLQIIQWVSFFLYWISSGASLHVHQKQDDNNGEEKTKDDSIVPYSYSLHRNSTYHISKRRFSFSSSTNGGSLSEILGIDSIMINQNFRGDGTGLGSAQWDGSFVLAEVIQRLDFTKSHDYMDQLLLSQKNKKNIYPVGVIFQDNNDDTTTNFVKQQQQQHTMQISLPVLSQVKIERRYQRKRRREELRRQQQQQQQQQQHQQRKEQEKELQQPRRRLHVVYPWQNKNTIELGSGLGLVSFVTCLLGATSIATDGDESVLDHARWNILYNLKQQHGGSMSHIHHNSSTDNASSGSWIWCNDSHPHNSNGTTTTGRVKTKAFLWGDSSKAMELLEDLLIDDSNNIVDDVDINDGTSRNNKNDDRTEEEDETKEDDNNNNPMDIDDIKNSDDDSVVVVDFILAADVVYGYDKDWGSKRREDTFHQLVRSFVDLSHEKTIIILAYKPRRPSEYIFFDMMLTKFEGAVLDNKLLHTDFSSSDMDIYLFRLKRNTEDN